MPVEARLITDEMFPESMLPQGALGPRHEGVAAVHLCQERPPAPAPPAWPPPRYRATRVPGLTLPCRGTDRTKRLILCGYGDVPRDREMAQGGLHLGFAHRGGMTLVMEEDNRLIQST